MTFRIHNGLLRRDLELIVPGAPNRMAGRYKIEAIRPDGRRRLCADWFPNLITDIGLDRFGNADWRTYCQVGSGNSTPTVGDTGLQTLVAATSTKNSELTSTQPSSPYYGSRTIVYRFATGVAAGNLSEVGVGWASAGSLFSRALILDGGGSPTTITVLADETLDVTYELRIYAPEVDSAFEFEMSSVTYDCVSRAANVTSTNFWIPPPAALNPGSTGNHRVTNGALGAITGTPSGSNASPDSTSISSYSNGTYYRDMTLGFSLNFGNLSGGISNLCLGYSFIGGGGFSILGARQISFSPAIDKDATKVLSLTLRQQWARKTL